MKLFGKEINVEFSKYFSIVTIISCIILTFAFVYNMCFVGYNVHKINKNQQKIEIVLKNIIEKNNSISVSKSELNSINKEFMKEYYVIQSDWLNKWFTVLAIIIAIFGIMIPICFVKFLETKEKEMDKVILEAKKEKEEAELNVKEMAKQLEEVNSKVIKVENYYNKTEAVSKSIEGEQKFKAEKYEEAQKLFKESLELNSNDDKTASLLGETYLKLKKYNEAETYILKAIGLKPKSYYYELLARISLKDENYQEAVELHKKAFDTAHTNLEKAFYLSYIAYDYSFANDAIRTNEYVAKAFSLDNNRYTKSICAAALANIKEYQRSIDILKELIIYNHAVDLYNLSEAYIMDGQLQKAHTALRNYIKAQSKSTMEGIFKDDYAKWKKQLKTFEDDENLKLASQIIQLMDTLKKEDRY